MMFTQMNPNSVCIIIQRKMMKILEHGDCVNPLDIQTLNQINLDKEAILLQRRYMLRRSLLIRRLINIRFYSSKKLKKLNKKRRNESLLNQSKVVNLMNKSEL